MLGHGFIFVFVLFYFGFLEVGFGSLAKDSPFEPYKIQKDFFFVGLSQ